jgi:hypothetical protein
MWSGRSLYLLGLLVDSEDAVCSSEMTVNFYQIMSQLRRQYSSVQTYPYAKCQGFIEMVLLTSVSYIEILFCLVICVSCWCIQRPVKGFSSDHK